MKFIRTDAIPELLLVGNKATIMSAHPNKLIEYKMQKMKKRILLTYINIPFIEIAVTTKLVNTEILMYKMNHAR